METKTKCARPHGDTLSPSPPIVLDASCENIGAKKARGIADYPENFIGEPARLWPCFCVDSKRNSSSFVEHSVEVFLARVVIT